MCSSPVLPPSPQLAAEITVKAGGETQLLGGFQTVENEISAVLIQRGSNSGDMQPGKAFQQCPEIHLAQIILGNSGVLAVIGDLAGTDTIAGFQIISTQPVGGGLLRGRENDGGTVDIIGPEHTDGALADGIVGNNGEEGGIDTQVRKRQSNIGLRAAVGGFEFVGHADFLIIGGCQAEHDLTDGDKLMAALAGAKGIVMFHNGPPQIVLSLL